MIPQSQIVLPQHLLERPSPLWIMLCLLFLLS